MEKARKRTPYDGRRNDWFDFARRQAEFYANAEQYITNLEVELGMIDETEGILSTDTECSGSLSRSAGSERRRKGSSGCSAALPVSWI